MIFVCRGVGEWSSEVWMSSNPGVLTLEYTRGIRDGWRPPATLIRHSAAVSYREWLQATGGWKIKPGEYVELEPRP